MAIRPSSVAAFFVALVLGLLSATDGRADPRDAPMAVTPLSREDLAQTRLSVDVLKELNAARTDPQGYADKIRSRPRLRGIGASDVNEALAFLDGQQALPPLAFSPPISDVALFHARDIGTLGLNSHTGSRGTTMGGRFRARGLTPTMTAEELSFSQRTAYDVVVSLIFDAGVPGKPHRKDLFSSLFTQGGVGCAPHKSMGQVCVINLSNDFLRPPPSITLAFDPASAAFNCPAGQQPADADALRKDLFRSLTDSLEQPMPTHWNAFGGANAAGQAHLDQQLGVNFGAYGSIGSPPWTPAAGGGLPFCAPPFGSNAMVAEAPAAPPVPGGLYGDYQIGTFDWAAFDLGKLDASLGICKPEDNLGYDANVWAGTIGGDIVFGGGGYVGAFAGYRDIDVDVDPFGNQGWTPDPVPEGAAGSQLYLAGGQLSGLSGHLPIPNELDFIAPFDFGAGAPQALPPPPQVGQYGFDVADIYAGYSFSTAYGYTSIQAGINNVFNTPPPKIFDGFLANDDAENYDYLGRYFYVGLRCGL